MYFVIGFKTNYKLTEFVELSFAEAFLISLGKVFTRLSSALGVMLMLGLLPWSSVYAAAPAAGTHTAGAAGTGSTYWTGGGGCSGCHTPAPPATTFTYNTLTYYASNPANITTAISTSANAATIQASMGSPVTCTPVTHACDAETNQNNISAYFASTLSPQLAAPAAVTLTHGQVWTGSQIAATPGADYLVNTTGWTIAWGGTGQPGTVTLDGAGVAANSTGKVSGTASSPAAPTVYTATITATNTDAAALTTTTGTATLTIGVNAAQTVTPTAPASLAMGTGGSVTVTGGSSGNAIAISGVSAACTASITASSATVGTPATATVTVTPVGVGSCSFNLNQAGTAVAAGSAGYDAATQAPVSITITQGTQTVSAWTTPVLPFYANNVTATIGATLNSGLTATLGSSTTGVCTVSGTIVTGIAAGTCTINATQTGTTNWAAVVAPGITTSFAVTLAPQTITMPAPTVVVGGTAVAIAPVAPSNLTVTLTNTSAGQCTLAGSPGAYTLAGLHAGTNNCVLNATVAGNTQYSAVVTPQVLNVSIGAGSQVISTGTVPTLASGATATLSPTATGSANAITFTSNTPGVCTVDAAGLITAAAATGGQTCTVLLDKAASLPDYLAAAQVPVNITVGLYSQSISLGAVTAVSYQPSGTTYGTGTITATASNSATPVTASPAVTFTSNTPATCSVGLTTGVITGLAAGTSNCTIVGNVAGVTGVLNPATLAFPAISILQTGQTLSFNAAPTTITVGTTGNASTNSTSAANTATGLTIQYGTTSASTICTVSAAGLIAGKGTGTCVVTADQAGVTTSYSAASQVTQSVNILIGNQTLVFAAAPTVNFNGTGAVSASSVVTSNSTPTALPVTYSSQTLATCSVVPNTGVVSGLAGGTCTIAANQPGTANYNPAAQVTQSFAINPIAQSINMTAVTSLVVGGSATLSSTTTSGLAVTYSSGTPLTCSISVNAGVSSVNGVAVGTCTINANQAGNGNYQAASVATQNVTVGAGSQTITFGAAPTVSVGGTGTVTATATSGLTVTFSSLSPTSICTISGALVTGVAPGTCTIAANQAGLPNYNPAPQVTQDIVIKYLPPSVSAGASMSTQMNTAATLDLTPFISGLAISGVSVPTQPSHGAVSVSGTKVTYTPAKDFFGTDSFKFLAYNPGGVSPAPATVTVTVVGRPDPTKDARVMGLIDIQTATVKRFGMVQVFNFQQRLESRHHAAYNTLPIGAPADGSSPAPAGGALPGQSRGYFNSWQPDTVLNYANNPNTLLTAPVNGQGGSTATPMFGMVMSAVAGALTSSTLNLGTVSNVVNAAPNDSFSKLEIWAAGSLRFGTSSQAGVNTQFSTDGISVGVDKRLDRKLTVGMGMGYARDNSSIGTDGTNSTANGNSVAGYASYQMDSGAFLDGLLGYGRVNFDTNRYVTSVNDFARASRRGDQIFGSLSFGYDFHKESLLWSPYGRYDYAFNRLNEGTETGAGANALSYASQNVRISHLSFGMRAQSVHQTSYGVIQPHARFEYQRGFEASGQTSVSYADLLGVQYAIAATSQNTNAVVLGLGSDFVLSDSLKLALDYQRLRSSGFENYQMINFRLTKAINGKNDLETLLEESYDSSVERPSGLAVAAGFAYDDNVSRASEVLDKLSDTIYSMTVSKSKSFAVTKYTKLSVSGFLDVEKFRTYAGLDRVSGGVQGEYKYRTSGEFGAPTFGIFARYTADEYASILRDGYHSSAGVTFRKPLTDRIDLFAAMAENSRKGRSDVFNTQDVSGRMNLDYALATGKTLYFTGEYRKGDIISSGMPSLNILDISTVLVHDDVFAGFYDYRMKGQTTLLTLGYNIALGQKDSMDFSVRRVQSTSDKTPISASGPLRYIVNQFSINYLMAF